MRKLAALPRHTVAATLAVILILVAWQVWTALDAEGKLSPEVSRALEAEPRVKVAVRMDFEPEKFHVMYFQDRARVVGIRGEWVYLEDVTAPTLQDIARQYWVRDIQLVP